MLNVNYAAKVGLIKGEGTRGALMHDLGLVIHKSGSIHDVTEKILLNLNKFEILKSGSIHE